MSETYTNVGLHVQLFDDIQSNLTDIECDVLYEKLYENNIHIGGKNRDLLYRPFIDCPIYDFELWSYDQSIINEWRDKFEETLIDLNINYASGTIKLFFVSYYTGADHPLVYYKTEKLPVSELKPFDMERHKKDSELEPLRKRWNISYMPAFTGPGLTDWTFKGTESELDKYLNENHCCSCGQCIGVPFDEQISSSEYFIEELKDENDS